MRNPALPALLTLLALLVVGCNTLPLGYNEIKDRVPADSAFTLAADSAARYIRYAPLGTAARLFFGADSFYRSRLLLRWVISETLSLDSIASVELVLYPLDSTPVSFVCRPCSTSWNESGISWLMADSFNFWVNPGGDWLNIDIGAGTTSRESTVITLSYRNLTAEQRAAIRENGIILLPQNNGRFCRIASRTTSGKSPRFVVRYSNNRTAASLSAIASAVIADTVRTDTAARTGLLIGSGVPMRTFLIFDLDSIPAAATITRADLELHPRTLYRHSDTMTLAVHRLLDPFSGRGPNARFVETPARTVYYSPPSGSDSTVSFDLRTLVQFWTTWPDSNRGLLLKASPEWAEFFLLRLNAAGPLAPRLHIQYVLPPKDRFH